MTTTPTPHTPRTIQTHNKWVVTANGKPVFSNNEYDIARGFLNLKLTKDLHSCYTLTRHGNIA